MGLDGGMKAYTLGRNRFVDGGLIAHLHGYSSILRPFQGSVYAIIINGLRLS
jgi:hypothetical protein